MPRQVKPEVFGKRLRELRGSRSIAQVARDTGVPEYTLARYEKGEIEKLSFQDVVLVGMEYGMRPDYMAALAEIWPVPEMDADLFEPAVANVLQRLRNDLLHAQYATRRQLAAFIDAYLDVTKNKRAEQEAGDVIGGRHLPAWVQQVRPVPTTIIEPDENRATSGGRNREAAIDAAEHGKGK